MADVFRPLCKSQISMLPQSLQMKTQFYDHFENTPARVASTTIGMILCKQM